MKAILESLLIPADATWSYFHRRLADAIPFSWHFHREIELTLTLNSSGQRYVGDSIARYGDADLVLIGPDLPHTWMSQAKINPDEPHVAHVLWIDAAWLAGLADSIGELQPLRTLLQRAGRGLAFSPGAVDAVRPLIEQLGKLPAMRRTICLLDILAILCADRHCQTLSTPAAGMDAAPCARIEKTLAYIHRHYQDAICMEALAELAALSVSGLHRLFKRHTQQTVGEYIAHLRIGKACSLLIATDRPVAWVSAASGYSNLSHFNRQFLAIKHSTPRQFRRRYAEHGPSLPNRHTLEHSA